MQTIHYLLDENIDPLLRTHLLLHAPEIVVWRIGDAGAPPLGSPDSLILEWCEERGFILVTYNRHSMPSHLREHLAANRHVPGILVLNADMSIGQIVEELLVIWHASDVSEYQDSIVFLPV